MRCKRKGRYRLQGRGKRITRCFERSNQRLCHTRGQGQHLLRRIPRHEQPRKVGAGGEVTVVASVGQLFDADFNVVESHCFVLRSRTRHNDSYGSMISRCRRSVNPPTLAQCECAGSAPSAARSTSPPGQAWWAPGYSRSRPATPAARSPVHRRCGRGRAPVPGR